MYRYYIQFIIMYYQKYAIIPWFYILKSVKCILMYAIPPIRIHTTDPTPIIGNITGTYRGHNENIDVDPSKSLPTTPLVF